MPEKLLLQFCLQDFVRRRDAKARSGFVFDALTRSIEYRKSRQAFIARGLSNAARASKRGAKSRWQLS